MFNDIDGLLVNLFWDSEWKGKVEKNKATAKPKLLKLNEFYGQNTYALGYPTLPDFEFAEFSYYLEKLDPELYKELPFLARLRESINNIPEIKKYYETKGSLSFVDEGDLAF